MAESAAAGTPRADWPDGAWLRTVLGYAPRDMALFRRALTHRSAAGQNNERLEFLGDSVLNLLAAEQVFAMFPDADEGQLSRLRSRVVSAGPLAQVGSLLGIGDQLQLGSGELKTGGFRRESILADATEADPTKPISAAGLPSEALPYMSPERTDRRGEKVDGRTDVYSLAATLYAALAGKPPFQGDTVPELVEHSTE